MKQKKLIIHPSTSLLFLLFYSPKPGSQVRILIYRKWSIIVAIKVFLAPRGILVNNRISILGILVSNRVRLLHRGLELYIFL